MAKKTLINRKAGTEHKVDNADAIQKKYKGVFREKPATEISKDVSKKEEQITAKDIATTAPKKATQAKDKETKK